MHLTKCPDGPNPSSHDGNGWGQWTRADRQGIGMDRTVATGTRNAGQYPPEVAAKFESEETTPDNLMLWFHHVPWTFKLHYGSTVIQHFYDAHYAGAETAQTFVPLWEALKGKMDDERHEHMLYRLRYQAGHSIVWRDAICTFYNRMTGIKDERGRVGSHPWRIEAESMQMSGYSRASVSPSEMASGGSAATARGSGASVSATIQFESGAYDIGVNYYDVNPGKATWALYIGDAKIGEWRGDIEDRLGKTPSDQMNGHSAARWTLRNVTVQKGQTVKVTGSPNGNEGAPIDYVVFLPGGVVD
jgi:alpha-glucuronidase